MVTIRFAAGAGADAAERQVRLGFEEGRTVGLGEGEPQAHQFQPCYAAGFRLLSVTRPIVSS